MSKSRPSQLWLVRACLFWIALGSACRIAPSRIPEDPTKDLPPPSLVDVDWGCDAERTEWTLRAATQSWTGGAELWLTADGVTAEAHPVPSVRAAADGSGDEVAVRLTVQVDPDRVRLGSSTRYLCQEPPDGVLVVFDAGGEQADCAWVGPTTLWMDLLDGPDCDEPFGP